MEIGLTQYRDFQHLISVMENLEKGQAQSRDCKTALDKVYQGNAAGAQEEKSHKVPETTFPIRKR